MVVLSEKDKEYIENTRGRFSARGIFDHFPVMEQKFGKEAPKKVEEEMRRLGYDLDFSKIRASDKIPTSLYMAFLVVQKHLFDLHDEDLREIGRETAKLSFLLRFASKFLISLETICENADAAWKKYYHEGGELYMTELDKEKGKMVAEVRNFVGHPANCRYLEGYFSQMIFFVVGKEVTCREEKCPSKDGGDIHRFLITWK